MQSATPTSRHDSAELLEHTCGLGDECEFRTKRKREEEDGAYTSRTISFAPIDTDAETEALLADADLDAAAVLSTLQYDACRPMTREEMRTEFVERRHDTLEVVDGVPGHREADQRYPWVEESQLRSSLKREMEYREELEREAKRRRTLGAMLLAYN